MDYHLSNVSHVVAACVVLHNICESLGDRCQEDWVVQDFNGRGNENRCDEASPSSAGTGTPTSRATRDTFADYLCTL